MESPQRLKQRHALTFIEESLKRHNVAYPIPELLWENRDLTAIGDLSTERAEAVLLYIVGKVIRKNKDNWFSHSPFDSVPLQAIILRQILGKQYRDYIRLLEEKELLIVSPYLKGRHSYRYNLPPKYQKSKIIYRDITDAKILAAIKKSNLRLFEENKPLYRDYANIIYWYSTGRLQLNTEQATNYLHKLRDRLTFKMLSSEIKDNDVLEIINNKLPTQLNNALYYIQRFRDKDYSVFIDPKGWRLYSALTMLMSPLRNYVTYDGQELCAIDIKNSQPFHFCHILRSYFWDSQQRSCSMRALAGDLFAFFRSEKPNLLRQVRSTVKSSREDIRLYLQLTTEGNFYEYLFDNLKERFPAWHSSREASKIRFLRFLNFDLYNADSPAYSDYKLFKEQFPNVCLVMESLKVRHYKDIGFTLQRLEAKMLLRYFVDKFSSAYPEAPIFTVHDSIIVPRDYKVQAKQLLEGTYNDIIGIVPTTDEGKDLNHENAIITLDDYMDKKTIQDLRTGNFSKEIFEELLARFEN